MPSVFSHAIVPLACRLALGGELIHRRVVALGVACSILPDLDVIMFKFGIPYASQWGHRGFTHSLIFAFLAALLAAHFYRQLKSQWPVVFSMVFLAIASHALLDACTDGGLGVALWWPISSDRHFLPWQPIQVSPIGISRFFSARGLEVIRSEIIWIWIPLLSAAGIAACCRLLALKQKPGRTRRAPRGTRKGQAARASRNSDTSRPDAPQ